MIISVSVGDTTKRNCALETKFALLTPLQKNRTPNFFAKVLIG